MQDGFIFSDTIAKNIAIGVEVIDKERLLHAVTVANIRDFVDSLPLGYNTKIGMEGNGVSQGQRQRILIARAIYKNPEYIFLDEATNALDTNNEREIMEHLHQFYKGRTVVVVAHRLSTVRDADNIVVLALLVGSYFFKYPDLITTEMTLTSRHPVVEYRTSVSQLLASIRNWEMAYCLMAPSDGKVQLLLQEAPNLYLSSGDIFARIVPKEGASWIGRALLPLQRSGKVKVGQRVIVRFMNFPDQEFGIVEGRLSSVSLVPTEDNYMVEIIFPKGLTTNYGKSLPVFYEMKATAEIVTDDLRLIERFFQPITKMLKENF